MRVKTGRVVLLDYMVRVETGQVVESSSGKAPIEYLHGAGQILPALERALEGLREGEQAAFSIPAEDAYGERKDDNVVSLPRTLFPDDVKLEQGLCLYARASGGQSYPITVREVKEDTVVVDLNHPLAGERLFFEVNIRGVRPAGNQEIFAGKAASMEVV
ncbi:MAG TPA: peptidylprolyl isomerase [Myxococcales bacterium]|nr:peptidylprolyl isomerase [Myxococcales bacterium]